MSEAPVCRVCHAQVPDDPEHLEPWFYYYHCDLHAGVPPAYLDQAREEFLQTGKTKWDKK